MDTRDKLDQLAEIQAQLDLIRLDKQTMIDIAMQPVAERIAEIEAECAPLLEATRSAITQLEAEIVAATLARCESVKGKHLQAVFFKGRTTWDTKKLEGLALAFPTIEKARIIGAPSVQIRKINK